MLKNAALVHYEHVQTNAHQHWGAGADNCGVAVFNGGRCFQKFPLRSIADELLGKKRRDELVAASCVPEQATELAAEAAKTMGDLGH